ncbi:DUF397 domain-containing protein [Amycolatopsis samaneae]|uniref:DUF397 domain-containing protein n=1 Tax=Amycolatopsis samaneae TaxID=664691 RepID=A0ABW5GHG5_9PSEU
MSATTPEASLNWFTSSYSGNNQDTTECVEVAFAASAAFIRDSKAPDSGHLGVRGAAWMALIRQQKG